MMNMDYEPEPENVVIMFEIETYLKQYSNHMIACQHCQKYGLNTQHDQTIMGDVRHRGGIKEREQ